MSKEAAGIIFRGADHNQEPWIVCCVCVILCFLLKTMAQFFTNLRLKRSKLLRCEVKFFGVFFVFGVLLVCCLCFSCVC